MSENTVLDACKEGIALWQQAFNSQNAAGCAAQYTQDSIMNARPFGEFKGREAIESFWQNIIDQGFADVEYEDVEWQPHPEGGYILTSSWTMNKAFGVVHREHWVIEEDGCARLISDDFEVQGER
ncbi:hypothetical protein MACH09_36400 [Vibrio sp. MACH09]|uniref:nuclear transport factor 2 family protein n=1 Tax=unclassified Vibrio TaxID=2614977 RepID=UPI00149361B1|nr:MULTISPECIES: nuclear transport factor 2 family protein [unclassified Vibrio]NOI64657.1 isochorismatase [Vibrio sp. 99-8-1]GLO63132.1 hypothetical protein MACH09_36400 [Vibrio sp. MACH09]